MPYLDCYRFTLYLFALRSGKSQPCHCEQDAIIMAVIDPASDIIVPSPIPTQQTRGVHLTQWREQSDVQLVQSRLSSS
jgi:hypothetical protein